MGILKGVAEYAYKRVAETDFDTQIRNTSHPWKSYWGSRAKLAKFRRALISFFAIGRYECRCSLAQMIDCNSVKDQIDHIAATTTPYPKVDEHGVRKLVSEWKKTQ